MTLDALQSKKLRITTKANAAQVLVIQDGSAADATATQIINDGFRDGYSGPLVGNQSLRRNTFNVKRLGITRDGRTFSFEVQDFLNRNSFSFGPGDKVEFWAENGAAPTITGSFPSWHSANQSGQVQHFSGFTKSFKRVERSAGVAVFVAECVDALQWANRIKLQRSKPNGVTIPMIVFNTDQIDDPDWFEAVKKYDGTASAPTDKFGYGNPKVFADAKMTLQEILQYLQAAYRSELYDRGMLVNPGDDLFDAAEIAAFTTTPPKTVFEATGFGDAIRALIRANVPDFDIVVDPRTGVWHFVAATKDIIVGGFGTIATTILANRRWALDTVEYFATSGPGSTVRLQSATDPRASEVATLTVVHPGLVEILLATPSLYAFGPGDFVIPMYDVAARPPSIEINLEDDCTDNDLSTDLDGVYTAVSIVSRHQITDKKQVSWTGDAVLGARLAKAYDTAYESNYRPDKHVNRRTDRGIDGLGIVVREREQVSLGNGTYFTRIYFSEETSLYRNDHDVQDNALGEAEWTGTAFHLLTYTAGTINCAGQNISAIITKFARAGWVDAAQTKRRFRIDLDRDLVLQVPTLTAEITDATTGDRFEMSSSDIFKPANVNKRYRVGRAWAIESTTVDRDARYLEQSGCPATAQYTSQNGVVLETTAVAGERASESAKNRTDLWAQMASDRAGAVSSMNQRIIWLHPIHETPPDYFAQYCATNPPALFTPKEFNVSVSHFKHEVLQVRFPETGFAGLAYLWHRHAEELQLVSESFEDISQSSQMAFIAQAFHSRLSEPHFSGTLGLRGVTRWLRLADMGFRTTFGPGDTGIIAGVVTEQRRFWGLVESIDFDLAGGTTGLSFTSNGIAEKLSLETFERQFVSQTAEMKALAERLRRTEQLANCLATRPAPKTPQVTSGCNVSHGSQSVSRSVTTIEPKEIVTGLGETALGAPQSASGAVDSDPASNAGSFDFHPSWVIERNFLGTPFAVSVPGGAVFGGTETGSRFVPSYTDPANPIGLPQHTADSLNEIGLAVLGIDLQTPKQSTLVECATGSTTTVIQLSNALPDDGRFAGGFIEFRGGTVPRPPYTILSHTSKTITLTGAMSEAAPGAGAQATVWSARLPTLKSGDFPQGGRPFKDRVGSWFVATGGQIIPATLAGTVLSKASSATAPDLGVVTKKSFAGIVIDHEQWIDFSANPSFDGGTGTIAATNPGQTSATVYNGDLSIYNYTDGSKRGNLIAYRLPSDLDESSTLSLTVVYRLNGAVGAMPNVEISIDALVTMDSDPPTTGTTVKANISQNMDTLARVSGDIVNHSMGTLLSSMTGLAGGLLHGVIYRDATGGPDDYTGTVQAVGAVLRMKRRIGGSDNDGNRLGGEDGEDTARFFLLR